MKHEKIRLALGFVAVAAALGVAGTARAEPPSLSECVEGLADIDACIGEYAEYFADPARFRREMETMQALQSEDYSTRAGLQSPALQRLIGRTNEVIVRMGEAPLEEQPRLERLAERATRIVKRMWNLEDDGKVSSRRHVWLFRRADRTLMRAEEILRPGAEAGR